MVSFMYLIELSVVFIVWTVYIVFSGVQLLVMF